MSKLKWNKKFNYVPTAFHQTQRKSWTHTTARVLCTSILYHTLWADVDVLQRGKSVG